MNQIFQGFLFLEDPEPTGATALLGAMSDPADGVFDEIQAELYERLKSWRKEVAAALGLESAYLLNRHVMARIAATRPTDRGALEALEGVTEWQIERHGDDLVQVLKRFEADVAAGKVPKKRTWRRR